MRRTGQITLVGFVLLCLPATLASAADLQEHTRRAFDRYAEEATATFLKRVLGNVTASNDRVPPTRRDGVVVARAGAQDGIIGVSDGLVHHWFATTFIAGATLEDTLKVSYAYGDYDAFYQPVIASQLLERNGNTFRALLRLRESAGGMTAVLDVTTRVEYFHPDPRTAYSISTSEEIREVKDPGTPRQQHFPAGRDSGYLWRAVTLARMIERDGGVVVEIETLGLSRSFPAMLGWIIEPIARRIGRKSAELSVQEFRTAVRAAARR